MQISHIIHSVFLEQRLQMLCHRVFTKVPKVLNSVLLCLMPDDFTLQVESAATQWVKNS
jgi:hypothetical protein